MKKVMICAAFIAAMATYTTAAAQDAKKECTKSEKCEKKCDSKDKKEGCCKTKKADKKADKKAGCCQNKAEKK
ncbi:MAG: hypothetical protein ACRC3Z_04590 [Phocaeicola sp.]